MRRADSSGEYFFDRDPTVFSAILAFYRTGKVFIPPNVNEELLKEEFTYFQIPVKEEPHCEVFSWGRGEYGQLGHGDRSSVMIPRAVETLTGKQVLQVSLGTSHSACLTAGQHVFTWGYGGDGRLGLGDDAIASAPRPHASHECRAMPISTILAFASTD